MQLDYGKQAFIKLKEFETRVENLEKIANSLAYNQISFDLAPLTQSNSYIKTVAFNSFKKCKQALLIKLSAQDEQIAKIKVTVNGILLLEEEFSKTFNFSCEVPFNYGENKIDLTVNATSIFTVNALTVEIKGCANYLDKFRRVTTCVYNSNDYALYSTDTESHLYKVNGFELTPLAILSEVKNASLVGSDENALSILSVAYSGSLQLYRFNLLTKELSLIDLGVNGVLSTAGYYNGNTLVALFIKLNQLYIGYYQNGNFTYNKTGITGASVYADFACPNAFVVSGTKGVKAYIVNGENFKGYMLSGGNNFHLQGSGEEVLITSEDFGIINLTKISNGKISAPTGKGFYEESALFTGKALNRIRDKLTITEIENV